MKELLKDYLEKDRIYSYKDVNIIACKIDGHICHVAFDFEDYGNRRERELPINIWEVLAFLNYIR